MSSRALRRLQQEAAIIRVSGGVESSSGDEENPGFAVRKTKKKAEACANPFAALVADADDEGEDDCDSEAEEADQEVDGPHDSHVTVEGKSVKATGTGHTQSSLGKKRKRKRKKAQQPHQKEGHPDQGAEMEEVDAAIKEVNELLGDVGAKGAPSCATETSVHRPLLGVEKRFLNADNEMRRIFGSRVVRAEGGGGGGGGGGGFATPKDTWPKMDKPGLTMELGESKDGHSSEYQKVQFQFLEAVETFDPNTIAAVLRAHPYHIDSLLQLSEVCRMSEDMQMATELLERALYCFECSFHTMFSMAHGNCRFNYSIAENRPFFIGLFRQLSYIGRKGCHRTALEFCKLLLSLDPEGDPLCVLLMVDYYALRGGEHKYLLTLFQDWEKSRNLCQLPNFAFSVPLAMFHTATEPAEDKHRPPLTPEGSPDLSKCNADLQEALIMFPNVLIPLMDKCGVTLDPAVSKHAYFAAWNLNKDPLALQLLQKLFVERNHSLWKVPEVLTWLEQNAREVVVRVDAKDPLVADSSEKRERRYVGTPRNIYRHVLMADFSQVTTSLPRDLSESGIMMYDPLPPLDSTSSYTRPTRRHTAATANENPLLLFLRSMLPTFENLANAPVGAGGLPIPHQQRLQAQLAAAQQAQEAVGQHGMEGQAGRPLDLQAPLNELVGMLQQVLNFIPGRRQDSDGYDSTSSEDR